MKCLLWGRTPTRCNEQMSSLHVELLVFSERVKASQVQMNMITSVCFRGAVRQMNASSGVEVLETVTFEMRNRLAGERMYKDRRQQKLESWRTHGVRKKLRGKQRLPC